MTKTLNDRDDQDTKGHGGCSVYKLCTADRVVMVDSTMLSYKYKSTTCMGALLRQLVVL